MPAETEVKKDQKLFTLAIYDRALRRDVEFFKGVASALKIKEIDHKACALAHNLNLLRDRLRPIIDLAEDLDAEGVTGNVNPRLQNLVELIISL